jgi:5'-deoxynucleotidase
VTEIITGDLPTPIKYYSKEIKGAYDEIEEKAQNTLISYLPDYLRDEYIPLLGHSEEDKELHRLVKGADKLSALIKCVEERKMGNSDFASAEKSTLEALRQMNIPEVDVFLNEFMPAYDLTLDEQA